MKIDEQGRNIGMFGEFTPLNTDAKQVDNSKKSGFDKAAFDARFGDRKIKVGRSAGNGYGISIEEVRVADEYERYFNLLQQLVDKGDAKGYSDAIYSFAQFISKEFDDEARGFGDAVFTDEAAARALGTMPYQGETQQQLIRGGDWTVQSDTLTNQKVPHYRDDKTSTANSQGFASSTVVDINFRGCGFVTAEIVEGHDQYMGNTLATRHSPYRVEIRVKGFKKEIPVVKMNNEPFDWEAHKVPPFEDWTPLDDDDDKAIPPGWKKLS